MAGSRVQEAGERQGKATENLENKLGVRFGVKIGQRAEETLLNETLKFMKYAVAQIDNIGV